MSAQHTPGPWKRSHLTVTAQINGARVAEIDPPNKIFRGEELAEEMAYCKANARLIAAAPELLAALRELVVGLPEQWESVRRARAAIRKATGEQP